MTTTLHLYDVYRCYANGRVSYRALLHPSERPACAEALLDTVTATGKRDAVKQALAAWDQRLGIVR